MDCHCFSKWILASLKRQRHTFAVLFVITGTKLKLNSIVVSICFSVIFTVHFLGVFLLKVWHNCDKCFPIKLIHTNTSVFWNKTVKNLVLRKHYKAAFLKSYVCDGEYLKLDQKPNYEQICGPTHFFSFFLIHFRLWVF